MDTPATPHPASLTTRTVRVTASLLAVQGIAVFAAAGTLAYWQGWLYMALQLVSMAATQVYLLKKDPVLLERRLTIEQTGETVPVQRTVIALMRLTGLALLVGAGLDRRFGWSSVPSVAVAAATAVFCAGALIVFWVFRENTYSSSVIEVTSAQTVVASGPYRFVRHPMYAGVLFMGLAAPLILGSYLAELANLPAFALLVVRILAEERFLSEKLDGYAGYLQQTRWRLIPGVW
jgi:protein-S-isoprenylcysteine O-methyltransferase Ste14